MQLKKAILIIGIILFLSAPTHAARLFSGDDRNDWMHYTGFAGCSAVALHITKRMEILHPRIYSFLGCSALGFFKEYVWDGSPTERNLWQNTGAQLLVLSFNF